jgi:16S rRNA processing protein RimM
MKCVGKIKEAHSLKGELYALIFSGEVAWFEDIDTVHLGPLSSTSGPSKAKGGVAQEIPLELESLTPFKIIRFKPHKKGVIIKLEGLADRTQAEKWEGFGLYVEDEAFISEPGETLYLGEMIGYELIDQSKTSYGPILEFLSNGTQDLLVVKVDSKEYLVPFVDPLIEKIDHESKKIFMNLPEGLFES